ncbi:MAG: hypothetical protein ACOCXG_05360 [Nanoarchaeota archaeon]
MKNILAAVFVLILLIFAGCSMGSNKVGPDKKDISGDGLRINFDLGNEKISLGRVDYEISLENTGAQPIEISQNEFILNTVETTSDDFSSVYTRESLDAFQRQIFPEGDFQIFQNQKIGPLRGSLFLEENFKENTAFEDLTTTLSVSFPYKTEFSNNVEIDINEKRPIKIYDSVSQAAPVQIKNIELGQSSLEDFTLNFILVDNGQASGEHVVNIKEYTLSFRGQELQNCKFYAEKDDILQEINHLRLDKNIKEVIISCPIEKIDEKLNTKIWGDFTYDYTISVSEKVRLK